MQFRKTYFCVLCLNLTALAQHITIRTTKTNYEQLLRGGCGTMPFGNLSIPDLLRAGQTSMERNTHIGGCLYLTAWDKGSPEGAMGLGRVYETGHGGEPKNLPEAAKWYGRAADRGVDGARQKQKEMEEMNERLEREWCQKYPDRCRSAGSTDHGAVVQTPRSTLEAQIRSGCSTPPGQTADQYLKLARTNLDNNQIAASLCFLLASSDLGNALAPAVIGDFYSNGYFVPHDPAESFRWCMLSAQRGWPRAQFSIGERYESGRGVPRNHEEALKWWKAAAAQGDQFAKQRLGIVDKQSNAASAFLGLLLLSAIADMGGNDGTVSRGRGPTERQIDDQNREFHRQWWDRQDRQ